MSFRLPQELGRRWWMSALCVPWAQGQCWALQTGLSLRSSSQVWEAVASVTVLWGWCVVRGVKTHKSTRRDVSMTSQIASWKGRHSSYLVLEWSGPRFQLDDLGGSYGLSLSLGFHVCEMWVIIPCDGINEIKYEACRGLGETKLIIRNDNECLEKKQLKWGRMWING